MTGRILCEKSPICVLASCFAWLLAWACVRTADAQSRSPAADVPLEKSGSKSATSDVRFELEANSRFGILTYVPGHWGELDLRLENGGDTPRNLLCTSYFDERTDLQFGRQVWLPARSRLSLSHPAFFPATDQLQNNTARIRSLVIDRSGGSDVLLKNESGQLRHERSLLMTPTDRNTGIVAGWDKADFVPQDVRDLVVASRVQQGLNNGLTVLSGQFLPTDASRLEYLDHIILAENRLIDDVAALAAVRRWLHAGGRLWVMLDKTDPILLEQLLGDDFHGQVVDRVGLTRVRIDKAPSLTAPDGEQGEPVDFDEPVEMARVVISGMKVWNSVNGWPVAMTRSYGEGRVLVTTLGPRGWIKPAPAAAATEPKDRLSDSSSRFRPVSPMEDLAAYVLAQRTPPPLPQPTLEALSEEYVSYSVPSWGLVIGMMAAFLACLFATGLWLWRSDRLEHFGWAGSLVAALFGIALTGIGLANRYSVPASIASVQLAQALGGTDDVRTRGTIAVYRPEGSDALVQATQGGTLWPDMTGLEGATLRMVTTDLGAFRWDGLTQSAGLQTYSATTAGAFADRLEARATLNDQGIVGTFAGHPIDAADALLATPDGRIGVRLTADGRFTAAASDVLGKEQYLTATFLGDVQDRRRQMLLQLFANPTWKNQLDRPQLLVWLDDWENGFDFGKGLQHQGETLLTVPLEITRPPTGAEMLIPAPLLGFETSRPPDGSLPAGFWDDARHEWQERSSPSTTWLSFQVPRSLLPVQATKGRLSVKVSGAIGRLEIMGVQDGSVVSLDVVDAPAGSLVFDLDDPHVLQVNEQGELSLGISCGIPADATSQSPPAVSTDATAAYWRIESLGLQLWATTSDYAETN